MRVRTERDRPAVKRRPRRAWAQTDHERALDELRLLAAEPDRSHPGAAASLREAMEERLTLTRLGIGGNLKRTLESTNLGDPEHWFAVALDDLFICGHISPFRTFHQLAVREPRIIKRPDHHCTYYTPRRSHVPRGTSHHSRQWHSKPGSRKT